MIHTTPSAFRHINIISLRRSCDSVGEQNRNYTVILLFINQQQVMAADFENPLRKFKLVFLGEQSGELFKFGSSPDVIGLIDLRTEAQVKYRSWKYGGEEPHLSLNFT